jgi:hypothetical protein
MDTLKARIERELHWRVKTPEPGEKMDLHGTPLPS